MIKSGNRGEWTEAYVFMRLLGDGRIYGASSELTKDDSTYIDIINIIRDEPDKMLIFERFVDAKIAYIKASKDGESIKVVTAPEFSEYAQVFLTLSLRHPKSKIQPFISVDQVCYTPFLFCKAECFCYRVIILRACNLYGDHGLRYPQCLINGVWAS